MLVVIGFSVVVCSLCCVKLCSIVVDMKVLLILVLVLVMNSESGVVMWLFC